MREPFPRMDKLIFINVDGMDNVLLTERSMPSTGGNSNRLLRNLGHEFADIRIECAFGFLTHLQFLA